MPNELIFQAPASTDFFTEDPGWGELNNYFYAGNDSGDSIRGAIRVTNVTLSQSQSISRAGLVLRGSFFGSGSWKVKIYGMKHTNVSTFNSGNPFGIYSKTTAYVTIDESSPSSDYDKDMTGIVNEIIGQSGWSSGNAMGFFMENDGSDFDRYYADTWTVGNNSLVSVRVTTPNLTPTPKTTAAPTFPDPGNYGLKISDEGKDVLEADEEDLLFTTRKSTLKIFMEGQVATSGGVAKTITHNLGYKPQALVYTRKNGYSFELPRYYDGALDPVGGGVQGIFYVDTNTIVVTTSVSADVYYYIFLDPQLT